LAVLSEARTIVFDRIGNLFPRLALYLAGSVGVHDSTITKADKVSAILLTIADAALIEASRQMGFLGGAFDLAACDLDGVVGEGGMLASWQGDVAGEAFYTVNRAVGFVPE
jgi:hypothetical protein